MEKSCPTSHNPNAPAVPESGAAAEPGKHAGRRVRIARLCAKAWILVKQSIRSLLSNKVRTMLSALGIMIGVAAVIATIAIANGAKAEVEKQLSRLGFELADPLSAAPFERAG